MTSPKRWPNNALATLENVKAILLDIDRLARQTQTTKDPFTAVVLISDIRIKANDAFNRLSQARSGNYPKELF